MKTYLPALALLVLVTNASAQVLPPGDPKPILRLEAGGPTSFVTSMVFSNDGERLYVGSVDKVVRVWHFRNGKFELDKTAYRVPIGPGDGGAINSIALSPDENWLAVGGTGIVRGEAGFKNPGLYLQRSAAFTAEMWQDRGIVYLFNTKNQEVKPLRGHLGRIFVMTFATGGKANTLVSVAHEWDPSQGERGDYVGVVRVWDVDKGTQIAERRDLPKKQIRPGVTAWRTGDNPNQVCVALTYQDGSLRVWDVAADNLADKVQREAEVNEKPRWDNTVDQLPGGNLLTSYLYIKDVYIQGWNVSKPGEPSIDTKMVGKLNRPGGDQKVYDYPRAMTLFSSQANGKNDHAAVVTRVFEEGQPIRYRMFIASLARESFGKVVGTYKLWSEGGRVGDENLPVITAAGGRFLAVAGNRSHEIFLHRAENLVQNKNEPMQVLKSTGTVMEYVQFVRKGEGLGLLLNTTERRIPGALPGDPKKGDAIFDLTKREVVNDIKDWKKDAPNLQGWKATHKIEKDDKGRITKSEIVIEGNGKRKVIELDRKLEVTDYALLPPMKPHNEPLLIVASHEIGDPRLFLYNARTGDHLRRYDAHEERVRSVAFSGDGRYIVTAGEDQMVCVWSLTDLHWVLNRVGTIPGLLVRDLLIVEQAGEKSELKKDEIIVGVDGDIGARRLYAVQDLYSALQEATPGSTLKLKVRDGKNETRVVDIKVPDNKAERLKNLIPGAMAGDPIALGLGYAAGLKSLLPDIVVKNELIVREVKDDCPLKGKIQENEVIESLSLQGKELPARSTFRFYEELAYLKPGTEATLAVRGKGNVNVNIGQGTDDSKPLFSMFFVPGEKKQLDWIGWSPIGPYETSHPRVERYIGWHFNTGDPKKPAWVALADQYRKEYERAGLIKHLIGEGKLAEALRSWDKEDRAKVLPQPKLTLWVDELGPGAATDAQGQLLVQKQPITVKLAVGDFPLDKLASVQVQVDDGPLNAMEGKGTWEFSSLENLGRGPHKIRVVVKTDEFDPQTYVREMSVRYQPPAPGLNLANIPPAVVNAPKVQISCKVEPAAGMKADFKAELRHEGKTQEVKSAQVNKAANQDFEVELKPGVNHIELVAKNDGALAEFELSETSRRTLEITYTPPEVKNPAPRISFEQVQEDQPKGKSQVIEPGHTLVVQSPKVKLIGRIKGSAKLTKAEWGTGDKLAAMTGFQANKGDEFLFGETISLKPGEQKVKIASTADKSEPGEATLTIEYRPQLPTVQWIDPNQNATFYQEADALPQIALKSKILSPNSHPFQATLLVNGKPAEGKVERKDGVLTGSFKPEAAGTFRLQLRLNNEWKQQAVSEELQIRVARPPRQIKFQDVKIGEKPITDLVAEVLSERPLLRESVEALVNGKEIGRFEVEAPTAAAKNVWKIKLKDVGLDAGKNVVKLWVSNTDARCRQPGEKELQYQPPAKVQALAEPKFLEPLKDMNVIERDLKVKFRVISDSPLKRVELVRDGKNPIRENFPLENLKPNERGEINFEKSIELLPKENNLRIVAINEGGVAEKALVVNCVATPVQMTIERVEAFGVQPQTLEPKVLADGKLSFPDKLNQAKVTVKGKVQWSRDYDEQFAKTSIVKVYVNGFQQIPATLKPAKSGAREREFEANVILSRGEGNKIEVELPGLKQEAGNRRDFTLSCAKPDTAQRLHLLVVGIGEKDAKALTTSALEALRANVDEKGGVSSKTFGQIRIYGPLTDYVTPDQVYTQLCTIKKNIDLLAASGQNDLVMVYYQGNQAVNPEGHFFETSASEFDKNLKRSAVTYNGMKEYLSETLGSKVTLLDVQSKGDKVEGKDQVSQTLPASSTGGVIRYDWLKESPDRKLSNLMSTLRDKMPESEKLADLSNKISKQVDNYRERYPDRMKLDRVVPESIEGTPIVKK